MAKKTKTGKNRLDKYYHLAKEQGYRSRAAFKLVQLNRKFELLKSCRAVLDLCAAPGGWLQVASKTLPVGSLIIGVDLVPIKPIRGVKCLLHDITTVQCRQSLKKEAAGSLFDLVLHDGAPNVGGVWQSEAYSQSALVLDSLKLATEFLTPKGTFVTKVFRSKDYNALLYAFNQLFDKVESTKPAASRGTSAEIFVVCQGYKAPAKIDPRLLDARHLFQEISEVKKVMGPEALLRQKITQRRHREGYEEGLSTLHKSASALEFVMSTTPVEMLGQYTKLALDGHASWEPVEGVDDAKEAAEKIRSHKSTTAEVKALCNDLQVLGRSEFKCLLRWRLDIKKSFKAEEEAAAGGAEAEVTDSKAARPEVDSDLDDETLLAEMGTIKEGMEARERREKKKRKEGKLKSRLRAAQIAASEGIGEDVSVGPDSLFSISSMKGKGQVNSVLDQSAPGEEEMEVLGHDSDDDLVGGEDDKVDLDSDDEALRYEAELDDALEDSYAQYLERKGIRDLAVMEKRKRLGMDGELDEDEDAATATAGGACADPATAQVDAKALVASQRAAAAAAAARDATPGDFGRLLVQLDEDRAGVARGGAAAAAQWFKQELFQDPDLIGDPDAEEAEREAAAERRAAKRARREAEHTAAAEAVQSGGQADPDDDASEDAGMDGEEDEQPHSKAQKIKGTEDSAFGGSSDSDDDEGPGHQRHHASRKGDGGFEVVPQDDSGSESGSESGSDDEFDMLDNHGKAEVRAIAKKMLRRSDKESILNDAYNRFAFHDTGLPRWFTEDENRHMRPIEIVSKAEVDEEKQRLKAIDARPIKKIAEAKARKKMRVVKRMGAARDKANSIADQEDVPMKSKMREIAKVMAKAKATTRGKGGKGKDGKGKRKGKAPPMDRKLKKDKIDAKRQSRKASKSKGGKGKGRR